MKLPTQEEHDALPWLHVYGQNFWHDEVLVEGTRAALEGLAAAIASVLATGQDATAEGIVTDGEGYDVIVRLKDRATLKSQWLPYADKLANGRQ